MRTHRGWNQHKPSKPILTVFNQHLNCRNHAITENLPRASFEVRPLDGLNFWRFRYDTGHHAIPFTEFYDLTCLKPGEQLASVSKFTEIYAWH